jgi:tetratricopeptide (TPR) repeat protein
MASPAPAAAKDVRLSPALVEATLKLALAQHQRGALDLAIALYDQVLTVDAGNADAAHLKGVATLTQGHPTVALPLIEQACTLIPASALFHRNRAEALVALGRPAEACEALITAIRLKPDWAEAHAALGLAHAALVHSREAKTALIRATQLDPKLAAAFNNLGVLHLADKETDAAVAAFRAALSARTDYTDARNGLGIALTEQGNLDEAITVFDEALTAPINTPTRADVLANRATTLHKMDRCQEALDDLQSAIAIAPERGTFWRNMAKPLIALGRIADAEAACSRALALNKDDQASRYERAFTRLLAGNIAGGFDDYRFRPTVDRQRFPIPDSSLPHDLSGRAFRLVLEQGLGEHLFFLRYAPSLIARGAQVACEIDDKLAAILKDQPALGRTVKRDEPTHDHEPVLIGDLPFLIGSDTVPASLSLQAKPALQTNLRKQLVSFGPGPYIALTWRAGIQDGKSLSKIMPLDALAPALQGKAALISIQRQPALGETEALAQQIGCPVHDLSPINDDLDTMLALLSVVDDYIGVSNTNMHLRAALGLPARVLVPHPPEFRWLAGGDKSPWFPDFTLYRAERDGWRDAIDRLSSDLAR